MTTSTRTCAPPADCRAPDLHGPAAEWTRRSTTVRVVTADPDALRPAGQLVDDVLGHAGPDRSQAADRCARAVADRLGTACLVSLGGDIATAGPTGSAAGSAWEVLVQDLDGGPAAVVAVPTGLALATVTRVAGTPGRWRAVTAVAADCASARTLAARLLDDPGGWAAATLPVRAVCLDGTVEVAGGWPADAELGDTPVVDLDDYPHPGPVRDTLRLLRHQLVAARVIPTHPECLRHLPDPSGISQIPEGPR